MRNCAKIPAGAPLGPETASRSSTALALVGTVAVLALVGVGVLAGILIGGGSGRTTTVTTASGAAAQGRLDSSSHPATVTIQQATPPPQTAITVPAPAAAQVTASGTWPAAVSAWTVVLASVGSKGDAESVQARASAAGLQETGVLLSTQHSSLRPGYWVAFSGALSHADAVTRVQEARGAGFSDAYARFVSAS